MRLGLATQCFKTICRLGIYTVDGKTMEKSKGIINIYVGERFQPGRHT